MLSNRDVKKVEDPINILEAAVAHLHCRTKLKQFMRGELLDSNALNVDLDVQCKLGRWLQRNDILPAEHLPLLARVKENHTEFHRYADTIFNKINNGEVQEAELMMNQEFSVFQRRLLLDLTDLNEILQLHSAATQA